MAIEQVNQASSSFPELRLQQGTLERLEAPECGGSKGRKANAGREKSVEKAIVTDVTITSLPRYHQRETQRNTRQDVS